MSISGYNKIKSRLGLPAGRLFPMISRIFFIIFFLSLTLRAFAGEDDRLYARARKMAKAGKIEFAFMQYSAILRDYPASRYTESAWFGKGEYHFLSKDYQQAKAAFEALLAHYPNSAGKLFALAYLWKIAMLQMDEAAAKNFEKEMINYRQVSLVFRDRKEYRYISPLNNLFKAAIHIDKIEIYLEGELFAKISY